jgi:integrase
MFRHTFVSILLSNPNIGVATVAAEAGHAQPSTTLAIYTQAYDKRRKEIRNQMSKETVRMSKKEARRPKSRAFLVGHEGFEPPLERL